ncbi:hypothetical protein [Bifidobacterium pseudolongum]|uniref:hypothetical protein n=1 Tax=Bifidobacterium pseudolongum TaxID=1694 RepID=UPI0010204722|nr:hypothetical protein [Bifidobacterium pseudolongum]RYQ70737.1 hypothetical protein PG2023B_1028 [Bifidobacterium pseudolongum subsp. globosum]
MGNGAANAASMRRNHIVPLRDLTVWTANPRIPKAQNEQEAIHHIYERSAKNPALSHRTFVNLAESILKHGFENEVDPVIVTATGGTYLVNDGNRRVSVMKVLSDLPAYQDMLTKSDYKRLSSGVRDHQTSIPDAITVAVFDDSEEDRERLNGILLRKHDGPHEGIGTLPWSLEAKDRFANRQYFSDKLEAPFEAQFGQSLTSRMGGGDSRSTTRRVMSSKASQQYLEIANPESASPDELDRVRELADAMKDYAIRKQMPLSRMNSADFAAVIEELRNKGKNPATGGDTAQTLGNLEQGMAPKDFRIPPSSQYRRSEEILGGLWNRPGNMVEDQRFTSLNTMLSGLDSLGSLAVGRQERIKKTAILSPSCRVFFALSVDLLVESDVFDPTDPEGKKNSLADKVGRIGTFFANEEPFARYLSEHSLIGSNYGACRKATATDFSGTADRSNDLSHRGKESFTIEDIKKMFNDAVLFAYLCEHYIKYKEAGQ